MPPPVQLIFLTPGFPIDESDTSCIPALQDFVMGWKEAFPEMELSVITFQYPNHGKRYQWHGIPVYPLGGKMRRGIFRFITWLKACLVLFRLHRKKKTILISCFLTETTLVGQFFSGLFQTPQIALAMGQDVRKENRYLFRIRFSKMSVVAFNEKMSQELFRSCGRKADYIIPMGFLESSRFLQSERRDANADVNTGNETAKKEVREIDILIAGSLLPLKQTHIAIKLVGELKKSFPKITSEIAGEGPQRNRLEELVDKSGLRDNISFLGKLNREAVFAKMQQSKILLHTSGYEGQATVITEALAWGITVVCFDVGRIVDHEKIKVCRDESEMLLVLKKLLLNQQFDFTPVIPVSMQDTIREYRKIILKIIAD